MAVLFALLLPGSGICEHASGSPRCSATSPAIVCDLLQPAEREKNDAAAEAFDFESFERRTWPRDTSLFHKRTLLYLIFTMAYFLSLCN